MADFGLVTIPTHYSIQPAELARWAEEHGFESLWFGEHTHIPTSRKTPFPLGGELPEYYKQFYDPFIGLTAAAVVTQELKVGTSVCLVPEHHPINLSISVPQKNAEHPPFQDSSSSSALASFLAPPPGSVILCTIIISFQQIEVPQR